MRDDLTDLHIDELIACNAPKRIVGPVIVDASTLHMMFLELKAWRREGPRMRAELAALKAARDEELCDDAIAEWLSILKRYASS